MPWERKGSAFTLLFEQAARLEGFNGLFQAARARARGYRNERTFMTMLYMIASRAGAVLKST